MSVSQMLHPLFLHTGEGMVELYNELRPHVDTCRESRQAALDFEAEQEEKDARENRFSIAVVGLPNVVRSGYQIHDRWMSTEEPLQ